MSHFLLPNRTHSVSDATFNINHDELDSCVACTATARIDASRMSMLRHDADYMSPEVDRASLHVSCTQFGLFMATARSHPTVAKIRIA